MVKINSPYKVKKMEISAIANENGNALYFVSGPGINSEYQGTIPQSLKGMEIY